MTVRAGSGSLRPSKKKRKVTWIWLAALVLLLFGMLIPLNRAVDVRYVNSIDELDMYFGLSGTMYNPPDTFRYLCTASEYQFILKSIGSTIPGVSLPVLGYAGTIYDYYLHELEGALVFVSQEQAIAFVFDNRDRIYLNARNKCAFLPDARAKIERRPGFVNVSVE